MEALFSDLRYGARQLLKSPAVSLMAVLSLAIGIGANTAIFSVVNALLLRPLPAAEPDRLVRLHSTWADGTGFHSFSYPNYLHFLEGGESVLSGLAAEYMSRGSLGGSGNSDMVMIDVVSEGFFEVLGIEPHRGRFFLPEEMATPGTHPVVVLDHRIWTRKFGQDPDILGEALLINGQAYTVVGVTPPDFTGTSTPIRFDAYLPMMMIEQANPGTTVLTSRGSLGLELIGRLAPGVDLLQAQTVLEASAEQLSTAFPELHRDHGVELLPATTINGQIRGPVKAFMAVLMAIVGLVLLIACVNVANMLLARALGRRREIAIRIAIGASRGRVLSQFLTETLLLFVLGGALGAWIASAGLRTLLAIELPIPIPIDLDLGLDPSVLLFTLAVTLVAGVISGLAPAFHATSTNLSVALKNQDARAGSDRSLLRSGLVVGQVALSLLLVAVAGLLVRGLVRASSIDPGIDARNVQLVSLDLSIHGYDTERARRFYTDLEDRMATVTGVESVGLADMVPLALSNQVALINVEGFEAPAGADGFIADTMMVSPGYLETLRVPLLEGRNFSRVDTPEAPLVALVNRTMAQRFWPETGAVGRRFETGTGDRAQTLEVVGVVADGKYRTLGEDPRLYFYQPFQQAYGNDAIVVHVRTNADLSVTVPLLRKAVSDLDPTLAILGIGPMSDLIGVSLIPQRLAGYLSGALGLIGLWLAAVGLYGVVTYSVSSRVHEIGIRMALGATGNQVLALVLRQGTKMALLGIIIGLFFAILSGRAVTGFLYGLSPNDPLTLAAAALLFLAVALGATIVPAWRASRIDPLEALRYE